MANLVCDRLSGGISHTHTHIVITAVCWELSAVARLLVKEDKGVKYAHISSEQSDPMSTFLSAAHIAVIM